MGNTLSDQSGKTISSSKIQKKESRKWKVVQVTTDEHERIAEAIETNSEVLRDKIRYFLQGA